VVAELPVGGMIVPTLHVISTEKHGLEEIIHHFIIIIKIDIYFTQYIYMRIHHYIYF
jgi:hypothetical protein